VLMTAAQTFHGSSRQLFEQRLRFLQVRRVESLGEPAVDLSEHLASFVLLTLLLIEGDSGSSPRGAPMTSLVVGARSRWHGESSSPPRSDSQHMKKRAATLL